MTVRPITRLDVIRPSDGAPPWRATGLFESTANLDAVRGQTLEIAWADLESAGPAAIPDAPTVPPAGSVRSGSWIVRAWFEEFMVAQYTGPQALATRYTSSVTRQFQGLRVTLDPVKATDCAGVDAIPADSRLWPTSIAPGAVG